MTVKVEGIPEIKVDYGKDEEYKKSGLDLD
jgi:hypothetical protein